MWPMFQATDGPPSRSRRRARSSLISASDSRVRSSLNFRTLARFRAVSVALIFDPPFRSSLVLRARRNRGYVAYGSDHPWAVRVVSDVDDSVIPGRDANERAR